jgi:hypothetical protein
MDGFSQNIKSKFELRTVPGHENPELVDLTEEELDELCKPPSEELIVDDGSRRTDTPTSTAASASEGTTDAPLLGRSAVLENEE